MKILGLFAVLISCTTAGFYIGDRYLSVLKEINRSDRLLKNIILGLQSEHMSIAEIFTNISTNSDLSTKDFIKNISLKNLSTGAKTAKNCGFCTDKSALSILSEAFSVLGKYSAKEQINELNLLRAKLLSLYEKNEEDFLSKAKLSRCFGVLFGIFIIILFL